MTQEQAESALMTDAPVECKGIVYKRIKSVIITKMNGERYVQVCMLDKNGNSTTTDSLSNVKLVREEVEVPF